MTVAVAQPRTIADLAPRFRYRTAVLVVGFAALSALTAQLSFRIPGTPVPVTAQTFAVLLAGGVLGMRAGAASQALYVLAGLLLPVYANGDSGWDVIQGATGGYLVGFIFAAAIVGALAERRQDRSFLTSLPASLMGMAIVYAFGVAWLAHVTNSDSIKAVELGLAPFVIADGLKVLLAGALLPTAWHFSERTGDAK